MTEPTLDSARALVAEARWKYQRDPREIGPITAKRLLDALEWATQRIEELEAERERPS